MYPSQEVLSVWALKMPDLVIKVYLFTLPFAEFT